jgi:prepilin-type N-terminal cleavage/methylation domain-containing protein
MICAVQKPDAAADRGRTAGFTLVELMVVLVVLAMLAALTLSGLAATRDRAKADKTRSTIRKLNGIVIPQYESYLNRRVRLGGSAFETSLWNSGASPSYIRGASPTITPSTSAPANRLWGLRLVMALEMPDQWADVAPNVPIPSWAVTPPVARYAAYKAGVGTPSTAYESAECLAMLVVRGGFDADAIESFRADELGDVDKDQCPEILDGWGRPIGFIRWPTGYDLPPQFKNVNANPDPFDPMRVSEAITYPDPSSAQTDYGTTPLIFSGGANGALDPLASGSTPNYGGFAGTSDVIGGWVSTLIPSTPMMISGTIASNRRVIGSGTLRPGAPSEPSAVRDNITNFDLLKN